jgi:hypothetical protein
MSLELYSTCISVLQNFGFFFWPPPKLHKFTKFSRNFELDVVISYISLVQEDLWSNIITSVGCSSRHNTCFFLIFLFYRQYWSLPSGKVFFSEAGLDWIGAIEHQLNLPLDWLEDTNSFCTKSRDMCTGLDLLRSCRPGIWLGLWSSIPSPIRLVFFFSRN